MSESYSDIDITSTVLVIVPDPKARKGLRVANYLEEKERDPQLDEKLERGKAVLVPDLLDGQKYRQFTDAISERVDQYDWDNVTSEANYYLLGHASHATGYSTIAQAIINAFPNSPTIQNTLTPFVTGIYPPGYNEHQFFERAIESEEYRSKEGAIILNHVLRGFVELELQDKAFTDALASLRLQGNLITGNVISSSSPHYEELREIIQELETNGLEKKLRLANMTSSQMPYIFYDLPREEVITSAEAYALSKEDARKKFLDIIAAIQAVPDDETHNVRRATDFALDSITPPMRIVIVDASDVSGYCDIDKLGEAQSLPYKGGFAYPIWPREIYIGTHDKEDKVRDIFLEECLHSAIFKIYRNPDCTPYLSDVDVRKKLLDDAMAREAGDPWKRGELDLSGYQSQDHDAEVLVKILKKMAQGQWTEEKQEKFPQLTILANMVMEDHQYYQTRGVVMQPDEIEKYIARSEKCAIEREFSKLSELSHTNRHSEIEREAAIIRGFIESCRDAHMLGNTTINNYVKRLHKMENVGAGRG